jgi:hypothetical protein
MGSTLSCVINIFHETLRVYKPPGPALKIPSQKQATAIKKLYIWIASPCTEAAASAKASLMVGWAWMVW